VRRILILVSLVLVIALGLAGIPVHFDEAQYSTWLAHPDWSYQTKGPLVTAVQSVTHGIEILPQVVQVRMTAWIAWLCSAVLILWLARLSGFDVSRSRKLLILFVTSPMLLIVGAIQTTDIWLLFFMLLALCAFAQVLHCRPNTHTELWWILMGGALGFGALAKLSVALVPLSIAPWVLLRNPRIIFTTGPYLGVFFCGLCMTPWILWNDLNGYAHLFHEFSHVGANANADSFLHSIDWIPFLLLAAPMTIFISIFGGLSIYNEGFFSEAESSVREMLKYSFLTMFVLFVFKGFFGEILINWTLPLVPVFLMGLASRLKWPAKTLLAVGIAQIILLVVVLFPYGVGLGHSQDLFQKNRGWDEMIERAARIAGPVDVITADRYTTLALALYLWPSKASNDARYIEPTGQVIPSVSRRRNQYDNWQVLDHDYARVVHLGEHSQPLARRCLSFKKLGEVPQVMPDGTIRSVLGIHECLGFSPVPAWPQVTRH
jgi:hypothetical protein